MEEVLSLEASDYQEFFPSLATRRRFLITKLARVSERVPTVLPEINLEASQASAKVFPLLAWKEDADHIALSQRQLQLKVKKSNLLEM